MGRVAMQDEIRDDIISEVWERRNKWAEASGRFQSGIKNARLLQLGLIIVGSVFATASASGLPFPNPDEGLSVPNKVLAGIGTVALALVAWVQQHFLSVAKIERWPRARAAAEAIKSEVYRFQAAAKPYDDTSSEAALQAALQKLTSNIDVHTELVDDLLPHLKDVENGRPAPAVLDAQAYISERLLEQADEYYLRKSQEHFSTMRLIRIIVGALALISAVVSALMASGYIAGLGAWVAVMTTVSLAVATYASLQRLEFLAATYAKQAKRLKRLAQGWRIGRWDNWSDFVNECEGTISSENKDWMAEMIKEGDTFDQVTPQNPND